MAPSSYNVALSVNTQPIALSQEANETRISTFYTLKTWVQKKTSIEILKKKGDTKWKKKVSLG